MEYKHQPRLGMVNSVNKKLNPLMRDNLCSDIRNSTIHIANLDFLPMCDHMRGKCCGSFCINRPNLQCTENNDQFSNEEDAKNSNCKFHEASLDIGAIFKEFSNVVNYVNNFGVHLNNFFQNNYCHVNNFDKKYMKSESTQTEEEIEFNEIFEVPAEFANERRENELTVTLNVNDHSDVKRSVVLNAKKTKKVVASKSSNRNKFSKRSNQYINRPLNSLEFESLKSKIPNLKHFIKFLPDESSVDRSSRIGKFLSKNNATEIVRDVTPCCHRVYFFKNLTYIEEDLSEKTYPASRISIYSSGFLPLPILGKDFCEAPLSVVKFLYANFPCLAKLASISDKSKRNSFYNDTLEKLKKSNQLPGFFINRNATFKDCKLFLQETLLKSETELKPLTNSNVQKLFLTFPSLQELIFTEPNSSNEKVGDLIAKLRKENDFPNNITYVNDRFFYETSGSNMSHRSKTPDLNWSLGAFDLLKLSQNDPILAEIFKIEDITMRTIDLVFHVNLRIIEKKFSYAKINKTEWGQNFIRNCALALFGLKALQSDNIVDNLCSMTDKILKTCPKRSYISRIAFNISKHLDTASTAKIVKE